MSMRLYIFLVPFFTSFTSLPSHATAISEISARLSAASCSSLFVGIPSQPTAPPAPPTLPTALKQAAVKLSIQPLRDRKEAIIATADHKRAINDFAADRRLLAEVQFATTDWFSDKFKTLRSDIDPAVVDLVDLFQNRSIGLIRSAATHEQLGDVRGYIEKEFRAIADLSHRLKTARHHAYATLTKFKSSVETALHKDTEMNERNVALQTIVLASAKINSALDISEIEDAVRTSSDILTPLIAKMAKAEQARRELEVRFDVTQSDNGHSILAAIAKTDPQFESRVAEKIVAEQLDSKPKLKRFIYSELQLVRRILKTAERLQKENRSEQASAVRAAALVRLGNSRRALERQALSDSKTNLQEVETLRALRRSIQLLTHASIAKSSGHNLIKTNVLSREIIVSEALADVDLRTIILNAGLTLRTGIPLPTAPAEPSRTPPRKPDIPRKVSSESQRRRVMSDVDAYNRKIEQFKRSWDDYKVAVETYQKQTIPKYQQEIAALKAAHTRLQLARESFFTYLGHAHPEAFETASAAHAIQTKATAQIRRYQETLDTTRRQQANSQVQNYVEQKSSGNTSSNNDLNSWWWWWYMSSLSHPPFTPSSVSYDAATYDIANRDLAGAYKQTDSAAQPFSETQMPADIGHSIFKTPELLGVPAFDLTPSLPALDILNAPEIFNMPTFTIPDIVIPEMPQINIDISAIETPTIQVDSPSTFTGGGYDGGSSGGDYGSSGGSGGGSFGGD